MSALRPFFRRPPARPRSQPGAQVPDVLEEILLLAREGAVRQSDEGEGPGDGKIPFRQPHQPPALQKGRGGHLGHASSAVERGARDRGAGEALVRHCLQTAATLGFRLMQFNAVVKENRRALHLYEKLGFQRIGEVPGGFLMKDGHYADIVLFYYVL